MLPLSFLSLMNLKYLITYIEIMETEIKQKRRPGRYPGKYHQDISVVSPQEKVKQDAHNGGKSSSEKPDSCILPNVSQDKIPSKIIVAFP